MITTINEFRNFFKFNSKKSVKEDKYEIRPEFLNNTEYWMIYKNDHFYERWNTPEKAQIRLKELQTFKHEPQKGFYISPEIMGGTQYWMIYKDGKFYQRCNTPESAEKTLQELNNK